MSTENDAMRDEDVAPIATPAGIFVSHSSEDDWLVSCIGEKMRGAARIDTFIDHEYLKFGQVFEREIIDFIKSCAEFCIIVTPWAIRKSWVWKEVGMAMALGKRIVPIFYGVDFKTSENYSSALDDFKTRHVLYLNEIDKYFLQVKSAYGASPAVGQSRDGSSPALEH